MELAIQIVWWIGLLLALLATLVILKQIAVVLRTLNHILELAVRTRDAARGLARGTEAIAGLDALPQPTQRLATAAAEVRSAADSLGRRIDELGFGPLSRD
jgi:hypothetical protein